MEGSDHGTVEFLSSDSVDESDDLFFGGAFRETAHQDDLFALHPPKTCETLGTYVENVSKDEESLTKPPVKPQRKTRVLVAAIIVVIIGIAVSITIVVNSLTSKHNQSAFADTGALAKAGAFLSTEPSASPITVSSEDLNSPTYIQPNVSPATSRPPSFHAPSLPNSVPSNAILPSPSNANRPSSAPSRILSGTPSVRRSNRPSTTPSFVSYIPGLLIPSVHGLKVSQGLTVRLIATTGLPVTYDTGGASTDVFHVQPDFGATFDDPRPWNAGGWIYVNNSENRTHFDGGVGALTFDRDGRLIDYRLVLNNTRANCGGGLTEWGAWISCEEFSKGRNWQVDPTGERQAQVISLGSDGGQFESFAYDTRNASKPFFFVTEDKLDGALQRWRPFAPDWSDPWEILLGPGETDFLALYPDTNTSGTVGTYEWTKNRTLAKMSAASYYPNTEGIEVHGNELLFISKRLKQLITLDLDGSFYRTDSTRSGLFDAQPDQIRQIIGKQQELLYFTEDSNRRAGIHARDASARFYTVLETEVYESETTGLAFSPDHKAMYFAYQDEGLLFEARRQDGLPFGGMTLNVQFHNT